MLLVLHFLLHRANRIEVTLMKGFLSFGALLIKSNTSAEPLFKAR